MMNNRVAYLISKKLSGDIAEFEISELNDALIANPEFHHIIEVLESSWETVGTTSDLEQSAIDRIKKKLEQADARENSSALLLMRSGVETPKNIPFLRKWGKYAVASILLFALGIWWLSVPEPKVKAKTEIEIPINEVTTKAGSKTRIVLPDGSTVWLNSDSRLSYNNMFQGKKREVQLSGEAYFEVVSNPERPFIIRGKSITVSVTGTTFHVRDYPNEKKSETLLINGKVTVSPNSNPEKSYSLKPNEKIIFKEESDQSNLAILNPEIPATTADKVKVEILPLQLNAQMNNPIETAWLYNQLAFTNASFRDVAYKMEKWYGVEIDFVTPDLERLRFSGIFENETLDEALEALSFSTPFHYSIHKNKVTIYK
jgi:ferric-dicitrate binding protein FerR (iron transport regulator)